VLIRCIDGLTEQIGRCCGVMTIIMTFLTTLIVVMRYVFDIGFIAMQEGATYLHASIFMLGVAYALRRKGHVRVDLIYKGLSERTQAWIDLVGHIAFLFPLAAFIIYISWDFVAGSWAIKEASSDAGGLPIVYLLKSLIPLSASLLALQCVAELLRAISTVLKPVTEQEAN